ncbi:MAG: hypothetical protein HOK52_09400 [Candidatus Marinimicrobia bacterium]|jgi:ribosomal protein L16 Arg81 hydroxylase|nr:hypothetical protein [Candidatus Neomarinimicrobiota bacterium]MBT3961238.1 hypothetical protein [Candidatus Neomarinimicrobiota bacterium]MBT4382382.1 hypothetical protein [Candidatus Neomarinimicrobiota bacterium]MBT4635858.1 hypothetical protein [Candidatus Neomarinimicrobiota bacterium]MBT4685098.1 hypothetical protein [Candidatus Neomarinimicrobiota bacterium]
MTEIDQIQTFNPVTDLDKIQHYFNVDKKPFVIRNVINSNVDLKYLGKHFGHQNVIALNDNSDKETLLMAELIDKINLGKKYRLRANTKLGNLLVPQLDTTYLEKIKGSGSHLFDHLLSFGKTSRQHTLFLSTRDCTFAKHAHIISGLIIHLYGQKTWYVSKSYDSFGSIKYKRLVYPNPLYITDKNPTNEIAFTVGPGDMIYMPAYWFHYTHSDDVNISYNHFFTEKIQYYLNRTLLMFLYQSFTNPIHSFIKAVRNEPEEHIFDRQQVIDNCNKIKNDIQRQKALIFFRDNDYS